MTQQSKANKTNTPKSINSLLIANRGEIASRIIRTCKKLGIRSIAIFSEADRNAIFVKEADFAICIGESEPSKSYLNQDKIINTCKKYDVDALHPGYGFLSENADFARKCQEASITFVGPHPEAIEAMGSKSKAKALMQENDVPTIPGYQGKDQSIKTLTEEAKSISFPLLLKATAGGGGKGMRIVRKEADLAKAIDSAKREAQNAFGNDELIIEKYISSGRHIEFQIFGDTHGNVIHILERECTIQRRYQKVIEESPSPVLTEELRQKMGEAALKAAKALQYDNAGTVEFIFDDKSKAFYFLEVNTRLQVEHPVSEEITGLDLVQLQIEVAEGKPLAVKQEDIVGRGYAVECRLYAEDAQKDFMPATGKIHHWQVPEVEGLRIESAVESGSEISIYYDPMIAKIIMWDEDRSAAHRKMSYTLRNLLCLGLTTNQDFLIQLFDNQELRQGNYDTNFLKDHFDFKEVNPSGSSETVASIAAILYDWQKRESQRTLMQSLPSGWRNSFYQHQQETYLSKEEDILAKYKYLENNHFEFIINNGTSEQKFRVRLWEVTDHAVVFELEQERYLYHLAKFQNTYFLRHEILGGTHLRLKDRFPEKEAQKVKGAYEAPMPSQVIKVLVEVGQEVRVGEGLVVLSSMKMENTIEAEETGQVEEVYVENGQNIEAGFLLLKVKD